MEGGKRIERPAVFLGGGIRVRWGNKRRSTWSILRGFVFLLHGGRESTEDTEVFEALCFWRVGFTIKKLRS